MHDIHDYAQIGIIHFMAFPETMNGGGPILETLRKVATDDYFEAVEITWIKDPEVRRAARELLETSRMTVAYGAQPRLLTTGLNINDLDPEARRRAIETLVQGIDEAAEMGCRTLAFLSGRCPCDRTEEGLQALVDSTKELCRYAASRSMSVVHEVFDCSIDKCSLIGPANLARRYAEMIREECENFGLMVDLSHIPLLGERPEEAIAPIREYLVHAHIGNCVVSDQSAPGYGDTHPRFGFPGSANDIAELADFLRVLLEVGFLHRGGRSILSFEVRPFGDEDPDLVIANAKRTLNQAWRTLW